MSVISPFVIDGIKCISDTSLISFNETVDFSWFMVTGLWRLWSNTGFIIILKYERNNKPLDAWLKEHWMLQ